LRPASSSPNSTVERDPRSLTNASSLHASLIGRFYEEVFNNGHVEFADLVHGPDYRYHDMAGPDDVINHRDYMERNAGFARAFPDRRVDVQDLIAVDDRVVARAVMRATHTGALATIAPTGRHVRLASTIIYRFANGRVAEEWEIFDKLGLYQQLGVTPPMG
jgi:steroid delta-isomerase-like uncharacterized protein